MDKEEMIEKLSDMKLDIVNTLKYTEPLDLPNKPYRMTVTNEDVILLENVIKHLKNT